MDLSYLEHYYLTILQAASHPNDCLLPCPSALLSRRRNVHLNVNRYLLFTSSFSVPNEADTQQSN